MKNKKNKLMETIKNRYYIIIYIMIIIFIIIFIRLFFISIINSKKYEKDLKNIVFSEIEGTTAPRGRIYDRNHKLLVDNIGIKSLYYKRISGISKSDEIDLAHKLSTFIDLNYEKVNNNMLKDLWLVINSSEANNKITKIEWDKLKIRKITNSDIELYKRERITEEELNSIDQKAAYIYYLMNNGYSYQEKMIKKYATDIEYAKINEALNEYKGMIPKLSWDRVYLYGDTLRGVFGIVSDENKGLTADFKDYYLEKGYKITDRVGISGLEYQYDDYLKGKKGIYKNTSNGLIEVKSPVRGNDLVLSIDIDLQIEMDKIIESEMIKTKNEPNTEYFNKTFSVISNPQTGEILALGAKIMKKINNEYKVYDYSAYLPTSSVTVGSVIKGASISVGYSEGVIDIGTVIKDECIKLANTPLKCSWLNSGLGNLDDTDALRLSSNSYQFKIAMMVSGFNYKYNGSFGLDKDPFKIYRNMFHSYGLGVKTGIDLPNESIGIVGSNDTPGLILDFSIGQYDTYTPLQLTQYINTIANNGKRLKLNILKEIRKSSNSNLSSNIIYKNNVKVLNEVDLDKKYIDRIKNSMKIVMESTGLGYGYVDSVYKSAGKTGTSQSFYDSNNDGVIDKETITSTFAAYAPYYDPKVSIVVVTPDVAHIYGSSYLPTVNRQISRQISKKYFEICK